MAAMKREQGAVLAGLALGAAGLAAVLAGRSSGPPVPLPPPLAPTGLVGTATSPTRITLAWQAPQWTDSYEVWRDGSLAFTTTATTLADSTVVPNTAYQYSVIARNASGPSPPSATVTVVTPPPIVGVPAVPTGLMAVVQ
jgi:chitinase